MLKENSRTFVMFILKYMAKELSKHQCSPVWEVEKNEPAGFWYERYQKQHDAF